ncbi:MAG TPA: serine/threonine-protein kinase [Kofleriaceae bacterium]|nr:serine/threonine-protein kinase [Kofleriaceae bacterium]
MPPRDRSGTVVDGRYQLEERIGRGASAEVYRALDAATQTQVAIKILRGADARDHEAVARFQREAEVQAVIRHRNVAALYGSGVTDTAEPYLVVELLGGLSLRERLRVHGPVNASRALSYAWQALQGLGAVHDRGILHRDLKPANIMLEPSPGPVERVVLIDFGFAALEGGRALTKRGHVVGSLTYLAPERLRGEKADERSDLYAMGVILYELLAGVPPFTGEDDFDIISAHLSDDPPDLTTAAPTAPPADVIAIVARALAKDRAARFPDAASMAAALASAARPLPPP